MGGADAPESRQAWIRLANAVALTTIGSIGMWSVVVVLPAVQVEFGVARADASLPFTLAMGGFALGGVAMGKLADRYGIILPMLCGVAALMLGYVGGAYTTNLWQFALAHGLIGFGSSATFGPLMSDVAQWFTRRRGLAVTICAAGNYLSGAIWPPVVEHFVASNGWRPTYIGVGILCAVTMLPLMLPMRRRAAAPVVAITSTGAGTPAALGLSPNALMALLIVAGVGCCVAMSMPQVHIVAYCGDLGYGVARGAEMLSLMLGLGIVSRVGSGFIADRIGGIATLLLGSALQGVALFLYLLFDGMTSLYVISGLFGLFQGGIVPMYAIIVRDYYPHEEAGTRIGIVLMATLFGMALGGWMSGLVFDLTGSYRAAFANGLVFNFVNVSIVAWLMIRSRGQSRMAHA